MKHLIAKLTEDEATRKWLLYATAIGKGQFVPVFNLLETKRFLNTI
jgi:hypothetical protein